MVGSSSKFWGKIWVGFCLNTGKRFLLEVSFWSQQKEHRFFYKMALGIFKIVLHLRDRHVFMWQSSSNINKVIRVISCLFHKKILHAQKAQKRQTSDFYSDVFYTNKKQTSFYSDVFLYTQKSLKSLKSIKSIKSIKSTKTSNKQLSLRCFLYAQIF